MGKYKSLLMMFIGITIGGLISYFFIGEEAMISTLILYLIILFVLLIEIYLETRNEESEFKKEREG